MGVSVYAKQKLDKLKSDMIYDNYIRNAQKEDQKQAELNQANRKKYTNLVDRYKYEYTSNEYMYDDYLTDEEIANMNASTIDNTYDNVPHINPKSNNISVSYAAHPNAGAMDYTQKFQRYKNGYEAGFDPAEKGKTYFFMTKPNINIAATDLDDLNYNYNTKKSTWDNAMEYFGTDSGTASSRATDRLNTKFNSVYNGFFQWVTSQYPTLAKSLNYSLKQDNNVPQFIPLLSNMFKSMNIDDYAAYEVVYGETNKGLQQRIYNTYAQSATGASITVSYQEDNNLRVTLLHKLWMEYIENVRFGYLCPTQQTLRNRELDFVSTIYYITVEPDGETINFWGRYIGVIPSSIPYSQFGAGVGENGLVDVSCTYLYSYKEFMNPEILYDFNLVANSKVNPLAISVDDPSDLPNSPERTISDTSANIIKYIHPTTEYIPDISNLKNALNRKFTDRDPEINVYSNVAVYKEKITTSANSNNRGIPGSDTITRFKLKFF